MNKWPCRSRAVPVACLVAGLGLGPFESVAGAAAAPTDGGTTAPIQRPANVEAESPAKSAPSGGASAPDNAVPDAPAEGPPPGDATVPGAPADAAGGAEAAAAPGGEGAPAGAEAPGGDDLDSPPNVEPESVPEEDPAIDPSLLESETDTAPTTTAPKRLRTEVQDQGAADAAVRKMYNDRYRPQDNPARLNIVGRALFANAGGREKVGGRMGGAQVDIGQSWNMVGYAGTVSFWGGRVFLPERTGAEMNALIGAGPTLALGRLALVGRGYLDFRAGYDFFYGVVNRRRGGATVVATQSDPDVRIEQLDNLAPHGPRLALSMGLLTHSPHRRYFHGIGVSMGWQALVGSFRGDLPFTNMLTIGLSYWMG